MYKAYVQPHEQQQHGKVAQSTGLPPQIIAARKVSYDLATPEQTVPALPQAQSATMDEPAVFDPPASLRQSTHYLSSTEPLSLVTASDSAPSTKPVV